MKPILYMAPIQGVTTCVYRNVYARLFDGYDYAMAPFVKNCKAVGTKSKALRDLFPERNTAYFGVIPQVLTNDPKDFIVVAQALAGLGYDTVNWNLGCPHKRIRNKKRGSGLLPEPERIVRILDEVVSEIPIQVSLKVRLGNTVDAELATLLLMLKDKAIQEIIIHPRTGVQMYAGSVDLDAFEKCLALTNHQVVYNGDINSVETFHMLANRFPSVNRWMIGRGGMTNPFLPEQIKGFSSDTEQTKRKRFRGLHDALFAAYQAQLSGPGHLIDKMKEFWYYWAPAFKHGKKLRRKIALTREVAYYTELVETFFEKQPELQI